MFIIIIPIDILIVLGALYLTLVNLAPILIIYTSNSLSAISEMGTFEDGIDQDQTVKKLQSDL